MDCDFGNLDREVVEMLCDKLKRYTLDIDNYENVISVENEDGAYMDAYEVEAAIEELKKEINRKEGVGQRCFNRCMEARNENIKLKHELWLARYLRALCEIDYWRKLYQHYEEYYYVKTNKKLSRTKCECMIEKWMSAKDKFIKKAEEYK